MKTPAKADSNGEHQPQDAGHRSVKNLIRTMAMIDADVVVHLPFLYFGTVVFAAIYIGVARRRRNVADIENLMNDNHQTLDPAKALADIQALACVAPESADPAVMRRDLEMILTTTEEALQPRVDHSRPCDPRTRTTSEIREVDRRRAGFPPGGREPLSSSDKASRTSSIDTGCGCPGIALSKGYDVIAAAF
jgi:hypothetical protein